MKVIGVSFQDQTGQGEIGIQQRYLDKPGILTPGERVILFEGNTCDMACEAVLRTARGHFAGMLVAMIDESTWRDLSRDELNKLYSDELVASGLDH